MPNRRSSVRHALEFELCTIAQCHAELLDRVLNARPLSAQSRTDEPLMLIRPKTGTQKKEKDSKEVNMGNEIITVRSAVIMVKLFLRGYTPVRWKNFPAKKAHPRWARLEMHGPAIMRSWHEGQEREERSFPSPLESWTNETNRPLTADEKNIFSQIEEAVGRRPRR